MGEWGNKEGLPSMDGWMDGWTGGLRLSLREHNNNSADPMDGEFPVTSPSLRPPSPPLSLAAAVDHLPNSELSKPSCNTGGNSGGRRRRRWHGSNCGRRATLRQSVRGRRGNQISLGGPASLTLYRS